jgi:hypothetical protein
MTNKKSISSDFRFAMDLFFAFFKKNIFGLGIGIVIPFLFWYFTKETVKVSYTYSKPNLIANAEINPRLIITYNGDTVKKATLVKFSFWNDGNKYIDSASISSNKGLSITSSAPVRILSINIIKKSRDNLVFNSFDSLENKTTNCIPVKVIGDDGLEQYDGAMLNILYSGDTTITWGMDGHIKGTNDPFNQIKNGLLNWRGKLTPISFWILIIFLLTIIFFYVRFLIQYRTKSDFKASAILSGIFIAFICYLLIIRLYSHFYDGDFVTWLSNNLG